MRIPFVNLEIRSGNAPYADAVIQHILSGASGDSASGATAIEEIGAGQWARAFASADVTPDSPGTRALTPDVLGMIGRSLLRDGEAVFEIVVDDGVVTLSPISAWTIRGGPYPWEYEIEEAQPDKNVTRRIDGSAVVHLRYGATTKRPWQGVSPLDRAATSRGLLETLETRIAQEAGGVVGQVLPVPDPTQTQLQTDISALKGQTTLVESTAQGWGQGSQAKPESDWQPRRLGAAFPPTLEPMRDGVSRHCLAAMGIPPSLLGGSDGTALREGWRQFLHGVIAPVSRMITPELAAKLDTPELAFTFDKLFASDLSGRARAFQSMVGGGMAVDKAAALAGLLEPD